MTRAEALALPVYDPLPGVFVRYTEEDYQNGAVGIGKFVFRDLATYALYYEKYDPMLVIDDEGKAWRVVRNEDGPVRIRFPEFDYA